LDEVHAASDVTSLVVPSEKVATAMDGPLSPTLVVPPGGPSTAIETTVRDARRPGRIVTTAAQREEKQADQERCPEEYAVFHLHSY